MKLARVLVKAASVLVLVAMLIVPAGVQASPGLATSDLTTGVTPSQLVSMLVGGGISFSNVSFTGANVAAGTFTGGSGIIGFDGGIVLSTGDIANVVGPNNADSTTAQNYVVGDADLDTLIPGHATYDASVLEFDFVPTGSVLTFQYVFGSEEYNEFVFSSYNDVFGFFVNGLNAAYVPGTSVPVAINNVNGGNPLGENAVNPAYYRNNDLSDGGGSIDTELDGLTTVLTMVAHVNPGETNHMRLGIADAGDYSYDSDVFIKAGSFVAPSLTLTPISATNSVGQPHTLTATATLQGVPQAGVTVTFQVTSGPNAGLNGSDVTCQAGQAEWTYYSSGSGTDTIVATATIGGIPSTSNLAFKTWAGTPDLVITDFWLDDGAICYTVKNQGSATAGASWAQLWIDGILAAGDSVASLAPSESRELCFDYAYACTPPGDTIAICADEGAEVTEADETNNCLVVFVTCAGAPDLVIDDFAFVPGGISYEMRNVGQVPAGLSQTALAIDGDVVALDDVAALGPGEASWLTFEYAYLCSPPGDVIEVMADLGLDVAESDETNNTLTVFVTCVPQPEPDLVISDFRFEGGRIVFEARNTGQGLAGPSWQALFIDGSYVSAVQVGPLQPGEGRWLMFHYDYVCSPPGDTIEIRADSDEDVAESDETNNSLMVFVTCVDPAQPDLVVEDFGFVDGGISCVVRNVGEEWAGPSWTSLFIDDAFVGAVPVGPLAPGEGRWLVFDYQYVCTFPGDTIAIMADSGLDVAEADESNNSLMVFVTCVDPAQPDLVVEDFRFVGSGISCLVRNVGEEWAGPSWTGLFVDDAFAAAVPVGPLAPGDGRWLSFDYTYVCSPPGDTVEMRADSDLDVVESDETNNGLLVFVTCVPEPEPDLVIDDFQFFEDRIGFEVRNVGQGYAGPSWQALFIDGSYVTARYIGSLAPGEGRWLSFEYSCTPPGDTIEIMADSDLDVAESDETNNSLMVFVTCLEPAQPDLVIDDFRFDGSTIRYEVRNIGGEWAGPSFTGLMIDDIPLGVDAVGPLAPGEGRWLSFDYTYWCTPPGDVIEIRADSDLDVAESEETNNSLLVFVTCVEPAQPDLVVEELGFVGGMSCVVRNAGEEWAGPSYASLFIDYAFVTAVPVGPLAPGEGRSLTFDHFYTCTAPGDKLEIMADSDLDVAESDETNNSVVAFVTCVPQAQPDLTISDFELVDHVVLYQVRNIGQEWSGPSWTGLTVDGIPVAEDYVGSLGPGEGRWLQFDYTYNCTPPADTIGIAADGRGDVAESNEENNALTAPFTCSGGTVVWISPKTQSVSPGTFTVDVKVNPAVPIADAQFDLSFDASRLSANSVSEGNLLKQNGASTTFNPGTMDNVAGTITYVWGATLGEGATVSTTGTFATITFTAKTNPGTSLLHLSAVVVGDVDATPVPITVTDGSVTIQGCPAWDVNCDGCISVLDIILVGQHFAETGSPGWMRPDVTQDGNISVLDIIVIGQHFGQGCTY